MAGEWRELPFSEAVLINPPVRLERGKKYPFVDMGALNPGARSAFATEEREFSGGGSRFEHGDTLMARITPCLENGKIARFCALQGSGVGHGSTEFIVIRGRPSVTYSDFACYLTLWEGVRGYAISHMTGTSGRQRVPTDCLQHLTVPIPPLPEQRAIAHILGTLDDKIELNRRMSKTLEAMARALFKAWFVDFEPVRAKMEGRWQRGQSLPGLPAHLYDLFLDRLVDSELGEIPEGWRVVRLGDLISFEKGRKPPVSYPLPCKGYLPVVLIENFNGIVSSYALPKGMTIAQEKDVLMVMDGASSGRVETGHYGIVGSTLAKITLREGSGVGTHFLYYALKLLEPEIREHLTGTSIPHADKNWISAQMVCFPNKGELLFYFEEIVGQIRERIRALRGESRTLAALRDVLLPKLIRGEIRVKDAERFLKERGL